MPGAVQPQTDRRPLLMIAVGRQRVGKMSILNTIIEYVRTYQGQLVAWNADTMNTTHSLSIFHPDVLEPETGNMEDVKIWIEGRIADLVKHRYDAALDIGGLRLETE